MSERKIHHLSPIGYPTGYQTCNLDMCPRPGIEPTTIWCTGGYSTQLSHLARAELSFSYSLGTLDRLTVKFVCGTNSEESINIGVQE